MGSFMGRGNQYTVSTVGQGSVMKTADQEQAVTAFPLEVRPGSELQYHMWEARVFHSATVAPEVKIFDRKHFTITLKQ